jgi:hypothetical protein
MAVRLDLLTVTAGTGPTTSTITLAPQECATTTVIFPREADRFVDIAL